MGLPPYYSINLKGIKLNNLPIVYEFLYTEELVAAYGKRERRSREGIGDEEKSAEIN